MHLLTPSLCIQTQEGKQLAQQWGLKTSSINGSFQKLVWLAPPHPLHLLSGCTHMTCLPLGKKKKSADNKAVSSSWIHIHITTVIMSQENKVNPANWQDMHKGVANTHRPSMEYD